MSLIRELNTKYLTFYSKELTGIFLAHFKNRNYFIWEKEHFKSDLQMYLDALETEEVYWICFSFERKINSGTIWPCDEQGLEDKKKVVNKSPIILFKY